MAAGGRREPGAHLLQGACHKRGAHTSLTLLACCCLTLSHSGQVVCFTRLVSRLLCARAAGDCGGAQERRGRRRGVSAAGAGGPVATKIQGSPCHTLGSARHGGSCAANRRASSCRVNAMMVLMTGLGFITATLQMHACGIDVSRWLRAVCQHHRACLSHIRVEGNIMSRRVHGASDDLGICRQSHLHPPNALMETAGWPAYRLTVPEPHKIVWASFRVALPDACRVRGCHAQPHLTQVSILIMLRSCVAAAR